MTSPQCFSRFSSLLGLHPGGRRRFHLAGQLTVQDFAVSIADLAECVGVPPFHVELDGRAAVGRHHVEAAHPSETGGEPLDLPPDGQGHVLPELLGAEVVDAGVNTAVQGDEQEVNHYCDVHEGTLSQVHHQPITVDRLESTEEVDERVEEVGPVAEDESHHYEQNCVSSVVHSLVLLLLHLRLVSFDLEADDDGSTAGYHEEGWDYRQQDVYHDVDHVELVGREVGEGFTQTGVHEADVRVVDVLVATVVRQASHRERQEPSYRAHYRTVHLGHYHWVVEGAINCDTSSEAQDADHVDRSKRHGHPQPSYNVFNDCYGGGGGREISAVEETVADEGGWYHSDKICQSQLEQHQGRQVVDPPFQLFRQNKQHEPVTEQPAEQSWSMLRLMV